MTREDVIWLMGVECRVRLGVPDWERKKPQKILLDVGLSFPLGRASRSDNVRHTADYFRVENGVRTVVESGVFRLAERLAAVAAQAALAADRRIRSVIVVVHKRPASMPRTQEVLVRLSVARKNR